MSLACQAASLLLPSGICTFAEILACTGPIGERVHLHFDDGGNLRCSVTEPPTGDTRLYVSGALTGWVLYSPSCTSSVPCLGSLWGSRHQEEKAHRRTSGQTSTITAVPAHLAGGFPPNPGFPTSQLRHQSADCLCRPGEREGQEESPPPPTHRFAGLP